MAQQVQVEALTEANDKTKQVQERCAELVKVETERNELKAKVCVAIILFVYVFTMLLY